MDTKPTPSLAMIDLLLHRASRKAHALRVYAAEARALTAALPHRPHAAREVACADVAARVARAALLAVAAAECTPAVAAEARTLAGTVHAAVTDLDALDLDALAAAEFTLLALAATA